MNFNCLITPKRVFAGLLMVSVMGLALQSRPLHAKDEADKKEIIGYTLPADLKPVELRFKSSGIVKSVDVKEGDAVESGKLLLVLDDTLEQAELAGLKEDVNENRILYSRKQHDVKVAEFKRQQQLRAKDAGNEADYEKAEAEVEMARLQISQEEIDQRVKKAKMHSQELVIEKMKLLSPLSGTVLAVDARPGEMVDPGKPPVVTIVNNKSLVVESNIEITRSEKLKVGQDVRVSYDKKSWIAAKVSFLAPIVDAASGLQKVHFTMENSDGKASGYQVFVEISDNEKSSR